MVGNPKPSYFTDIRHRGSWPLRSSRSLLAATLTLPSGGFQLAVALGMNLSLSPREHTIWRYIADGAVQPDIVVSWLTLSLSCRAQDDNLPNHSREIPALPAAVALPLKCENDFLPGRQRIGRQVHMLNVPSAVDRGLIAAGFPVIQAPAH